MKKLYLFLAMALMAMSGTAFIAPQAHAQACVTFAQNCPPPAGAIFDLAPSVNPHVYTQYSVAFSAVDPNTNVTFAFREDPNFIQLSDVVLTDLTNPSGNLLLNGDFSLGPVGASAPTDWTYLNQYGAADGGVVRSGCGISGDNCYYDGAVQAYDAITQVIGTTVGDIYDITFWAFDPAAINFSDLSTNGNTTGTGGNGIDMLVYAGVGAPAPGSVPTPASLALLGVGLFGIGALRRKMKAL